MSGHGNGMGGYGGPRPGDFGGCTYRPMGDLPPASRPDRGGGNDPQPGCWGCAAAAGILVIALIAWLL